MNHDKIRFEAYSHDYAQAVARMWEESRDGWPPGFLGNSKTTAQSVIREEDLSGGLFTVIALDGKRVVGYCRTEPYGGEADASYVAILNAVTDMHGKKIGKRLLLDAIRRVTELGYYRLDLHTWSANLKAVPLYKKTGFFWMPDTMVYMQNYMPFLLQRSELKEFLGDSDWYLIYDRELEVEPDLVKSLSGRKIFPYRFKKGESVFSAEFDVAGRILSGLKYPDGEFSLEREKDKVFFGKSVNITLKGDSLPDAICMKTEKSLLQIDGIIKSDKNFHMSVKPEPQQIPFLERERAPRITIELPGKQTIIAGMGLRAEEAISLESPVIRRPLPGQEKLSLLFRRHDVSDESVITYAFDGKDEEKMILPSCKVCFQGIDIPMPELTGGPHDLSLRVNSGDRKGVDETILLTVGDVDRPVARTARKLVSVDNNLLSMSLNSRGGKIALLVPTMTDKLKRVAGVSVIPGPPFHNSDFPYQRYSLNMNKDMLKGETDWPSKPGFRHSITARLDSSGFMELKASVMNGSDKPGRMRFNANWWSYLYDSYGVKAAIPVGNGIVHSDYVFNRFPETEEDFPEKICDMGAPWMAITGVDRALMAYFPGWEKLEYKNPVSEEMMVEPGETLKSPTIFFLFSEGSLNSLLRTARSIGWKTGKSEKRFSFPTLEIDPVMLTGGKVYIVNQTRGSREASIEIDGKVIAKGRTSEGNGVSAGIEESGFFLVKTKICGCETEVPVYIASDAGRVMLSEEGDDLLLENSELTLKIGPKTRGHIYSVRMREKEYLLSSHPEPSEFAWDKPWFGGIRPLIYDDRENPFPLEKMEPETESFCEECGNMKLTGWKISWKLDKEKYGSFNMIWKIGLLPGLPVVHTEIRINPLAGGTRNSEFGIQSNIAPEGNTDAVFLTSHKNPLTRLTRDHSGSWDIVGNWARVTGPEGGFVEVHNRSEAQLWSEDYAEKGSHLSLFEKIDRKKYIKAVWLFGKGDTVEGLSRAFRFTSE